MIMAPLSYEQRDVILVVKLGLAGVET